MRLSLYGATHVGANIMFLHIGKHYLYTIFCASLILSIITNYLGSSGDKTFSAKFTKLAL
jgi:hypothetical protein